MYGVIMAGGRGSRFWPRSRRRDSKQVLNIVGKNTMIQDTVENLLPLIKPKDIWVVTNSLLEDKIQKQLPRVPERQILVEPVGRNTAPCIGLGAIHLLERDPDAVMGVFPADSLISDRERYVETIALAEKIALEDDALVTVGITPARPETGFGYIKSGDPVREEKGIKAYRVQRFVEKPDRTKARRYLVAGDYYWNSGMFVWKASRILEEIKIHLPDLHKLLMRISKEINTPFEIKAMGELYPKVPAISIDYGVMEKARDVVMIRGDFGWNDVGSWNSLYEVWPKDENKNAVVARHISMNSTGNLVYSPKKFVALVGIENVILVETQDAILLCHRDRAQDVSEVVKKLRELREEELLG